MRFYGLLFFALLLKVANSSDVTSNINYTISRFSHEINKWLAGEEETEEFQQFIRTLALPTDLQLQDWRSFDGERGNAICIVCTSVVNSFLEYRKKGMSGEDIAAKAIKMCNLLNLQTDQVCEGVVSINLPIILHIVDSKPNITASTVCGVILESQSCPLNDDEFKWTVNVDNDPPKWTEPKEGDETINIVQITDIHYDPRYESYGKSLCKEPACCRKGQNDTNTGDKVAGYWGDYNSCDSPWHTVVDVLDHIRAEHQDISYVYFTGDIVDHGVWETTVEGNKEILNKTYPKIHEVFKNVPVYPIVGNHEAHPVNQFAPKAVTDDKISTQWLYKMMADLWINFGWLPESTRSTILQGGFYTVSPKKGFRIIALNDNVCYTYNWWLWYHPRDLDGQLQWLADTLLQAEKDGEYVHILAHVPPGHQDCQTTWRREYIKVLNRFAHIIRAQFNGHTHNDEIKLIYGIDDNEPHNVAWNGGSATTFSNLNSNYKLYTVDSENYAVKDYDNWIYNLTEANANPDQRPAWYKSYSFKEEYGLSNLTHSSLQAWLSKLANDKELLSRYYRNYFKRAEPSLRKDCDATCMRPYLCNIITSLGDQKAKCDNNQFP